MKVLTTVEDVIEALGGATAAARLCGLKTPGAASLWASRGWIPPEHWLLMTETLRPLGMEPRLDLFGFTRAEAAVP